MTITFGTGIYEGTLETSEGTEISVRYGDFAAPPYSEWSDWQRRARSYTVTVGRSEFAYWVGDLAGEPAPLEALSCLFMDADMTDWSTNMATAARAYRDDMGGDGPATVVAAIVENNVKLRRELTHREVSELRDAIEEADL